MAGQTQELPKMWATLQKKVDLDDPVSFTDQVHLECAQRAAQVNDGIVMEEQILFSKLTSKSTDVRTEEKNPNTSQLGSKVCWTLLQSGAQDEWPTSQSFHTSQLLRKVGPPRERDFLGECVARDSTVDLHQCQQQKHIYLVNSGLPFLPQLFKLCKNFFELLCPFSFFCLFFPFCSFPLFYDNISQLIISYGTLLMKTYYKLS